MASSINNPTPPTTTTTTPTPIPNKTTKKQLTLFVTIQVSPPNISKFKEAHRPIWVQCAREEECLLFDVFQDPECPGRFRFVEVWSRDREWFEKEQLTKPYYKTLWEKSKPLWVTDIQMEYFEREGEGSAYSEEYLAGGRMMEKGKEKEKENR